MRLIDPGPASPQVSIPLWALVHLPVVVTLSTAAFTPNGWVHSILYVLFENAMGIVKLGAVIAGARLAQLIKSQQCSCAHRCQLKLYCCRARTLLNTGSRIILILLRCGPGRPLV